MTYEIPGRTAQYPELRCVMKVAMHFPCFKRCPTPRTGGVHGCCCCGLISSSRHCTPKTSWVNGPATSPTRTVRKRSCLPEIANRGPHRLSRCSRSTPLRLKCSPHQRLRPCPRSIRPHSPTTKERQQWIVGYANGSIDFRDSWGTQNLPDFRISQVTGDKAINAITS